MLLSNISSCLRLALSPEYSSGRVVFLFFFPLRLERAEGNRQNPMSLLWPSQRLGCECTRPLAHTPVGPVRLPCSETSSLHLRPAAWSPLTPESPPKIDNNNPWLCLSNASFLREEERGSRLESIFPSSSSFPGIFLIAIIQHLNVLFDLRDQRSHCSSVFFFKDDYYYSENISVTPFLHAASAPARVSLDSSFL